MALRVGRRLSFHRSRWEGARPMPRELLWLENYWSHSIDEICNCSHSEIQRFPFRLHKKKSVVIRYLELRRRIQFPSNWSATSLRVVGSSPVSRTREYLRWISLFHRQLPIPRPRFCQVLESERLVPSNTTLQRNRQRLKWQKSLVLAAETTSTIPPNPKRR